MEKKVSEIKNLKKGSYILIDDVPCKVESIQISRPGKHGGAKARLLATGLFDNQKRTIIKPANTKINIPIIEKKNAQLIAFIGENAQLMDLEDYSMYEVPISEELKQELVEGEEVLVWKFGKNVMIKGKKS